MTRKPPSNPFQNSQSAFGAFNAFGKAGQSLFRPASGSSGAHANTPKYPTGKPSMISKTFYPQAMVAKILLTGVLLLALVSGGLFLWGRSLTPDFNAAAPASWKALAKNTLMALGNNWRNFSGGNQYSGAVFAAGQGKTQEEARAAYRHALLTLKDGSAADAVREFQALEAIYPGLKDFLLLHEAEAYEKLPDEGSVQRKLESLIQERSNSPLVLLAKYRLGQSHFRARDYDKANAVFHELLDAHPHSEYATGAMYYLGWIAGNSNKTFDAKKASSYWVQYLKQSPDGRFAGDIAQQLDAANLLQSAEIHQGIGLGLFYADRDPQRALSHLLKAPSTAVWLPLGQLQIRRGFLSNGKNTLLAGIPKATNPKDIQAAVDILARNLPADQLLASLKTLASQTLPAGGDYVLWKLSQLEPAQSTHWYKEILSRYPKGDYAPESSWLSVWSLFVSGQTAAFLNASQSHLTHYPYARSAANALFWRGKAYEKNNQKSSALQAYEKTLKDYPTSYYAFRANGRIQALKGKGDPGWQTAGAMKYPPTQLIPDILPPASVFQSAKAEAASQSAAAALVTLDGLPLAKSEAVATLPTDVAQQRYAVAQELAAIGGNWHDAENSDTPQTGAIEDLYLFVQESLPSVPASIASYREHLGGDHAKGIRTMRDALTNAALAGDIRGQQPTKDELKLLYPLYFSEAIATEAPANGLNPYLVQSLMREESYFNEVAVSSSNAMGLMQLLPTTAKEVAGWVKLPSFQAMDLFDPAINTKLGSRYLGYLHQNFASYGNNGGMMAVGAYNGGPNAMKRWVSASSVLTSDPDLFVEAIPYEQSRDYIKKVYGSYWNYTRLYYQ